ncbi:superoxide dismutase family protein [uncultured Bdellovibrio sp.]|uniref:superoxide dismutase family protein n=1 Tax=Bdellovibrio sp. HCB-162 TaxID=3394234 RepID=UPI0025D7F3A5|nr:superoxide dismutase family protein [uncultured Bdellovibrio sp.]
MGKLSLLCFVFVSSGSVVWAAQKVIEPVAVIINNAQGEQVGDLNLTQEPDGVKVTINLTKLSPGTYAAHFHEKGVCKGPDFKSAGEHFNPSQKQKHGHVKGGPHAGDLKNIEVKVDGQGHSEEINTMVTLKEGPNSLLKRGGTTIIIHERPDDYQSQPSGASGKRIACGEIKTPDRTK